MNDFVMIGVKKEDLENSIERLGLLKPIVIQNTIIGNQKMGSSKQQIEEDIKECTKDFDTAITAMTMLLSGFADEQN